MTKRRFMVLVGDLPAGNYYIGDPCYAVRGEDRWHQMLSAYYAAGDGVNNADAHIFEIDGHRCFISCTNHGDGEYRDQHGEKYGVDSGLLSCLPLAVTDSQCFVQEFKKDFPIAVDPGRMHRQGKRIWIGHLRIKT